MFLLPMVYRTLPGDFMYKKLTACRICGNTDLKCVLSLGAQVLTGVFPPTEDTKVTAGPLRLVKCMSAQGDASGVACGLLQLEHSYDLGEMYGDNYGYRSGLNLSMVSHLQAKVARIKSLVTLDAGDLVIDIGSNDSTTLQAYAHDLKLLGVDPTGIKFKSFYPAHIDLIPDFFSASLIEKAYPGVKAKVVTSFSMFYDLESPMDFMRQVHQVLAADGIWVFEQSYMPLMLETNSYDTVCHEHLEFYALQQIKWMTDRVGFTIVDVELNDVNGGSFSITVCKKEAGRPESPVVEEILRQEEQSGLNGLKPFEQFQQRCAALREELLAFIADARAQGKTVMGLGASTKGNVLLQYCGIDRSLVPYIGEVNREKFGCFTPGSLIPIIDEKELLQKKPDYLLILPWHFRGFFENSKVLAKQNLVFPLPTLSVRHAPTQSN